jgi:hypothetical protein
MLLETLAAQLGILKVSVVLPLLTLLSCAEDPIPAFGEIFTVGFALQFTTALEDSPFKVYVAVLHNGSGPSIQINGV